MQLLRLVFLSRLCNPSECRRWGASADKSKVQDQDCFTRFHAEWPSFLSTLVSGIKKVVRWLPRSPPEYRGRCGMGGQGSPARSLQPSGVVLAPTRPSHHRNLLRRLFFLLTWGSRAIPYRRNRSVGLLGDINPSITSTPCAQRTAQP